MLRDAINLIDEFIDDIDDARKGALPVQFSRADLVDENSITDLVDEMRGVLSAHDAAEAERYLRLKVTA